MMKNKETVYQLRTPPRIIIRNGGTSLFLEYSEIDWIEAKGLYTVFHSGNHEYQVRQSITELERRLDPNLFVRIHRSIMINIHRVRKIRSWLRGEYKVILMDGTELCSGRTYKERLLRLIHLPAEQGESVVALRAAAVSE